MPQALRADVERYLAQQRVERRLSSHTLQAYRRDLDLLLAQAEHLGLTAWSAFGTEALRSFIAGQHRRGLSPKSLQRLLSSVRSFFKSQLRDGALPNDPTAGLRAPKAPCKLPQVLDPDEMTQLVEIEGDGPIDVRDRALLELMYSSGLRLSEVCGLRWRDLDLADGTARVRGKGDKVRLVPVGSHARAALEALRAMSTAGDPGTPVFRGRDGGAISPRTVQLRVKAAAQRQGVFKRVHPHLLRHSCASHVLESSGDLRGVQELLGHADIATTQIYTHLDFQHLARVYDAAHPRAKRRSGS